MPVIFCYGCLNSVRLGRLLGRNITPTPGILEGYCRIVCGERDHWKDEDGSGGGVFSVWKKKGCNVEGSLVWVSDNELVGILDKFENQYVRKIKKVLNLEKGKWVRAWVYVRKECDYVVPPSRKYLKEVRLLLKEVGFFNT